jgi:ABC-type Mn2+/Zn2+ transport system permease subunit
MGASFFIIFGLIIWLSLAFLPAYLAKKKGYSFLLFLVLSWFVSFLATLLVVVILKDKNMSTQDRADERAAEAALERDEANAARR